jgi:CubicO group peptidase (beta-lactamase class C family)
MLEPLVKLQMLQSGRGARRGGSVLGPAVIGLVFGIATICAATAEPCANPANLRDGWERASPEDAGLDGQKLCAVLETVRDGRDNVHSLLVARRGKLVAELYRPGSDRSLYSLWPHHTDFGPTDRHDMRSISKSVFSLLYGILEARGQVPDVSTPVISLYPEHAQFIAADHQAIRIEHLLSMSSGLEWNEPSPVRRTSLNDEVALYWTYSVYRRVFQRDLRATPGTVFTYSGGATAVLADVVARSTKRYLREVAQTELFDPLGIADWEWVGDCYGTAMAFAGLRMRPRDLLKIGWMVLDGGRWQGRQIVPQAWLRRSLSPKILAGPDRGYGYNWWTRQIDRNGKSVAVTEAIGNGGQRLFLLPALELAVVMTSGHYNEFEIQDKLDEILRRIVATVNW